MDYARHAIMPTTAPYLAESMGCGDVMNSVKSLKAFVMVTCDNIQTDRIQNGRWKEFNKHAVLIADGYYVDGKKHGTWREFYDETGNIMIEEHYDHGVPHGKYTSFHPNGQIFSTGQFINGSREGVFTVYDEEGNYTRHLLFVNNVQVHGREFIHVEEESGRATN